MEILAALLLSFIPAIFYVSIVYWLDRYEKEPKLLVGGVFVWGAVVAAGIAFIVNTVFGVGLLYMTASETTTEVVTSIVVAPLIEEGLKAMVVLLVFLLFRKEFDSVMDGIVYAATAALGFAASENALYLIDGFAEDGWSGLWVLFFLRVIFGAWNHAAFTAFTGIGLGLARLSRSKMIQIGAPLAGFSLAMFAHFLHNTIASLIKSFGGLIGLFFVDWFGWLFMGGLILWALWHERSWIRDQLKEEVLTGLITQQQYQTAVSAWARAFKRLRALPEGRYGETRRFFQLCTELAYKKHQLARLGEEGGDMAIIQSLREEIGRLAEKA
ncbi:MAG: PrsW family intramembrane metalloprotease [Anaerolineae bacterium]|nr:PrsW family intramembrane metalloprotease [Anaerolineae bacterium]